MALNLQKNIDKVAWTFADKVLYGIYGIVTLIQMRYTAPSEYGLFALLIAFHTWIFVISDAFSLQGIIQFGMNTANRAKANLVALFMHALFISVVSLSVLLLSDSLAELFNEVRFGLVATSLPVIAILFIPRTFCLKLMYRDHNINLVFFANLAFFGSMAFLTFYFIATNEMLVFKDIAYIYSVGALLSSIVSIILVLGKLKFSIRGSLTFKQVFSFSLPFTITNTFHYAPRTFDLIIIQLFFSTAAVGVYYSAKTLFRFFEDGINAAHSLVYPAAVRLREKQDYEGLQALVRKSITFVLFLFVVIFVILQFGFGELIIKLFLPQSYYEAIGLFNFLLIAALFLPYTLLFSVITAYGKHKNLMYIVISSALVSLGTFYSIGQMGREDLIPLGTIVYVLMLSALCIFYINKNLNIKIRFSDIYLTLKDIYAFLKSKIKK